MGVTTYSAFITCCLYKFFVSFYIMIWMQNSPSTMQCALFDMLKAQQHITTNKRKFLLYYYNLPRLRLFFSVTLDLLSKPRNGAGFWCHKITKSMQSIASFISPPIDFWVAAENFSFLSSLSITGSSARSACTRYGADQYIPCYVRVGTYHFFTLSPTSPCTTTLVI